MRSVGMFEAKTRLSEICEEVAKTRRPILVTRRGKPLVRIDPIEADRFSVWEDRAAYIVDRGTFDEEFVIPDRSDELPDAPFED